MNQITSIHAFLFRLSGPVALRAETIRVSQGFQTVSLWSIRTCPPKWSHWSVDPRFSLWIQFPVSNHVGLESRFMIQW